MQRYESYKPSGVEWIGEVPAHWGLKKSKFLWREKEDRSIHGDEELLSVSQYSGVVPRKDDSRSESLEDYKRCEPNDLVINIMRDCSACCRLRGFAHECKPKGVEEVVALFV